LPGFGRTDVYRFDFSGKEKLDEINGHGNDLDFGAREYDGRLGRRWKIEPKPQVNLSDYSVIGDKNYIIKTIKKRKTETGFF